MRTLHDSFVRLESAHAAARDCHSGNPGGRPPRHEGVFGGASEETEYDVFEATQADVVELDGRRSHRRATVRPR